MIDTGGFALSRVKDPSWTCRRVARLLSGINGDIFVSLDYPPSPVDSKTDRVRKIRKADKNYSFLLEHFPQQKIMPVIHGRSYDEVKLSIELVVKANSNPSWVGVGGLVPLLLRRNPTGDFERSYPERFIAWSIREVRLAFPGSRLHAFGAAGPQTFLAAYSFGADSADSIGWRQAAGYGSIFLPGKTQRALTWKGARPPRRPFGKDDFDDIQRCECPSCRRYPSLRERLSVLRKSFEPRAIHNAWVVMSQSRNMPRDRSAAAGLIANGQLGRRWADAAQRL